MARTDVSEIIERIRRQLNSTVRMEINTLGSSLTTTTNPVTLTYDLSQSLREGSVLAVGTELMRVISVDRTAKEATVLRGYLDSGAEAHAQGDEVQINPRFTRFDIFDAIISEIDTWAPDIFYTQDWTTTITGDETQGVEVPVEYIDALGVASVHRNFTEDESAVWPTFPHRLYRGRAGSLTPGSGTGLFIRFTSNGGYAKANGSIAVRMVLPFNTETITEATDLSTLNVTRDLLELIELGVKARLIGDDETGRSARTAQDEPRRTEEVQAGAALSVAQTFLQRYERRRNQVVRRLRTTIPFQAW